MLVWDLRGEEEGGVVLVLRRDTAGVVPHCGMGGGWRGSVWFLIGIFEVLRIDGVELFHGRLRELVCNFSFMLH